MSTPPKLDPESDVSGEASDVDARKERRDRLAIYVRDRLRRETGKTRGLQAEIAKATKFSTAHVANVKNGKAKPGDDFARAIAAYWELTLAELEAEAMRTVPASAVRDPYPNRSLIMQSPEYVAASDAVCDAFLSLRGNEGGKDKTIVQWAIDLNRLIEWERMGLLDTAGGAGKKIT